MPRGSAGDAGDPRAAGAHRAGVPASAWAKPQYRLLVLAIPNKYHYDYIPIARNSLENLARLHDFALTYTDDQTMLAQDLTHYTAVVFLNHAG